MITVLKDVLFLNVLWELWLWSHSSLLGLWLRAATKMVAVLTKSMIAVLTKCLIFEVFMRTMIMIAFLFIRTAIMIAILIKYPIFESVLKANCNHESQFLYQHRHHQHTPFTYIEWSLILSRFKNKQNSLRIQTTEICKKSIPRKKISGAPRPLPTPPWRTHCAGWPDNNFASRSGLREEQHRRGWEKDMRRNKNM